MLWPKSKDEKAGEAGGDTGGHRDRNVSDTESRRVEQTFGVETILGCRTLWFLRVRV